MKQYYVYILASKKNGVLYVGVTNDLTSRISQHRTGAGSKFAYKYRVFRLVYTQLFADVGEAIAAEKSLKKWRRAWKVALIEKDNLEWVDLLPEL
jgi:putative endonuclease